MCDDGELLLIRSGTSTRPYKYKDLKVSGLVRQLVEDCGGSGEVLPLDSVTDEALGIVEQYGAAIAAGFPAHTFASRLTFKQMCDVLPVTEFMDVPCLGNELVARISEHIINTPVADIVTQLVSMDTPESAAVLLTAPLHS